MSKDDPGCPPWPKRTEFERLTAELEAEVATLRTLVRRAAESGPGCFYCDVEEGHTADCEAAAALS